MSPVGRAVPVRQLSPVDPVGPVGLLVPVGQGSPAGRAVPADRLSRVVPVGRAVFPVSQARQVDQVDQGGQVLLRARTTPRLPAGGPTFLRRIPSLHTRRSFRTDRSLRPIST